MEVDCNMRKSDRSHRRAVWWMLGLAILCTVLAMWPTSLRAPKSAFKPISGVVVRFERQRTTRGRLREFVILEVEGKPFFLNVSGYFADRMRLLKKGDHVKALVSHGFAAELQSSGSGSFTYDEYASIKDKETKSGHFAEVLGAAIFWAAFVFGIVDRRLSAKKEVKGAMSNVDDEAGE